MEPEEQNSPEEEELIDKAEEIAASFAKKRKLSESNVEQQKVYEELAQSITSLNSSPSLWSTPPSFEQIMQVEMGKGFFKGIAIEDIDSQTHAYVRYLLTQMAKVINLQASRITQMDHDLKWHAQQIAHLNGIIEKYDFTDEVASQSKEVPLHRTTPQPEKEGKKEIEKEDSYDSAVDEYVGRFMSQFTDVNPPSMELDSLSLSPIPQILVPRSVSPSTPRQAEPQPVSSLAIRFETGVTGLLSNEEWEEYKRIENWILGQERFVSFLKLDPEKTNIPIFMLQRLMSKFPDDEQEIKKLFNLKNKFKRLAAEARKHGKK